MFAFFTDENLRYYLREFRITLANPANQTWLLPGELEELIQLMQNELKERGQND